MRPQPRCKATKGTTTNGTRRTRGESEGEVGKGEGRTGRVMRRRFHQGMRQKHGYPGPAVANLKAVCG